MCWLNSLEIIKVHDATDKIHVKYVTVVGSLMYVTKKWLVFYTQLNLSLLKRKKF